MLVRFQNRKVEKIILYPNLALNKFGRVGSENLWFIIGLLECSKNMEDIFKFKLYQISKINEEKEIYKMSLNFKKHVIIFELYKERYYDIFENQEKEKEEIEILEAH